jgi:myosin heavy subunit
MLSEHRDLLRSSTNEIVASVFARHGDDSPQSDKSARPTSSVVSQFRMSLDDVRSVASSLDCMQTYDLCWCQLVAILDSSQCHFIRCINPSQHAVPNEFNESKVVCDWVT